ncbi:MAG: DUF5330 domain-containing protein [Rhizobiaceae bacterium]|nr:DUF5330 domain-containing protein [Rhizobiaceae bacterium]
MGFLIRMTFWFSLVLLVLPLGPASESAPSVNPIQAFFAAKEAVDDFTGICERKPEVCEVGKAAMQTIGSRAREGARIVYEMLDEDGKAPEQAVDTIGPLLAEEGAAALSHTDGASTGSVSPSTP